MPIEDNDREAMEDNAHLDDDEDIVDVSDPEGEDLDENIDK